MPPAAKNTDHGIGIPYSVLTQCGAFHATRNSPRGVRCPGLVVPVRTGPKVTLPQLSCNQASLRVRSTQARAVARQCSAGGRGRGRPMRLVGEVAGGWTCAAIATVAADLAERAGAASTPTTTTAATATPAAPAAATVRQLPTIY
jgi:hypothetical protein